ncbi:MAG: hypothetical protein IJY84_02185 [Clostridia bacterium]|nr:hypothetical protein [Clostridia bacterium]
MMKKTSKIAMITALLLAMAITLVTGITLPTLKVDADASTVVKNDGTTTDFVDYWWNGGAMSSVLNEQGETVITLPNTSYGHRMNNGKDKNGTGTDIYTASISYTMSTGLLGFFAFATSGSQYLQNESIAIVLNGANEGGPVVTVGLSHDSYDYSYPVASTQNVRFDIVCTEIENGGGVSMSLKINGEEHVMTFDEAYLNGRFGEGVRDLDEVFGGWESVTEIVVHDYNDSHRAAYLAETKATYDAVLSSIAAIDYSGLTASSELDDIVAVYGQVKEVKAQMQTLALRNREKGFLNSKFAPVETALNAAVGDDDEKATLVDIASYIDVFAATVEAGLDTKPKAEVAESLKTAINLDALNDIIDLSETYSEYASEKKAIYNDAKNKLADAKDALVLADIVKFEESVKDLSDNDKILASGSLKNVIFIENALADNQEEYQARVSAAAAILSKAVKNYAGDLAKSWDIYNVTFIKANENGGIDYFATDYYDDDPSSDVGISFRDKFQLDGFSINFTYTEGPTGANAWLGLHFFSELDVMHISDTDEFEASTGITTLIIPKAETTEFQMGYPKLYGNCPVGGWPVINGGTVGTDINVRFEKVEGVYNVYVKMGDAEEQTLCVLDASILETYLVNGEGYLNIGSCDKDLNTCKITINTINGKPAASFVAENEYVEEIEKPETSESEVTSEPAKDSTVEQGSGCGGAIGGGSVAVTLLAVVGVIFCKKKKED